MSNKALSIILLVLWSATVYLPVPGTDGNLPAFMLGLIGIVVFVFLYNSFMPTVARQSGESRQILERDKVFPFIIIIGSGIGAAFFHNVAIGIALAVGCNVIWFLYRLCVRHYSNKPQ